MSSICAGERFKGRNMLSAAREWLNFIKSPAAVSAIRKSGMEPA